MKPIKDILGDTKPKNVKKVTKAFENGGWKFKACPNCGVSQKLTSAEFKALKKA